MMMVHWTLDHKKMRLVDSLKDSADSGRKYMEAVLAQTRGAHPIKQFDRYWTISQCIQLLGCTTSEFKAACKWLSIEPKRQVHQRVLKLDQIQKLRDYLQPRQTLAKGHLPIICVLAGKGGCAKSTYSVHLAQKLVLEGKRVLLIDTDPQGSATSITLGVNPDVFFQSDDTVAPFMMKQADDVKDKILNTGMPGLDLIPCCQAAAIMDLQGMTAKATHQGQVIENFWSFKKVLESLHTHFDAVVIDTPPTLTYTNMRCAIAANLLITPIGPSLFDFCSSTGFENTLLEFLESLMEVDDSMPQEIHRRRFVISRYDHRLTGHQQFAELIRTTYPSTYATPFFDLTEIVNAAKSGNTIYDQQRAVNSSGTRKKALEHLDLCFAEVIKDIEQISQPPTTITTNIHQEIVNG